MSSPEAKQHYQILKAEVIETLSDRPRTFKELAENLKVPFEFSNPDCNDLLDVVSRLQDRANSASEPKILTAVRRVHNARNEFVLYLSEQEEKLIAQGKMAIHRVDDLKTNY